MASFFKLKDGHILNVELIAFMHRWGDFKAGGCQEHLADCRASAVFSDGTEFMLHPDEEAWLEGAMRKHSFVTHPDAAIVLGWNSEKQIPNILEAG